MGNNATGLTPEENPEYYGVMWILHKGRWDVSIFYAFPLFVFLLMSLIQQETFLFAAAVFLFLTVIDAGHVYATVFRSAFHSQKKSRKKFLMIFFGVLGAGCLWLLAGWPGFFEFVLYFTFYHNLRQLSGINSWYQKISNERALKDHCFIYLSVTLSFLALHYHPRFDFEVLLNLPVALTSSSILFYTLIGGAVVTLLIFLYLERSHWNGKNAPRILSVLAPGLLFAFCIGFGNSFWDCVVPLLVLHGATYIAVVARSLPSMRRFSALSMKTSVGLTVALCLVLAVFEGQLEGRLPNFDYRAEGFPFYGHFLLALVVTPQVWHFIVDSKIWRATDEDARRLYQMDNSPSNS